MANLTDIRSSWSTGASEGGVTVYATKENLPSTGLTSGDQAYVTNTSRLYISNGSGWYNVALINATPSLTIDPTGAIALAKDGSTPTVITLTATDSDNAVSGLTFSVDSDGSFGGLATVSQDSSVFTITPLSEASATTTTSTLTFKASDGISFGSGQRTLSLTFSIANSKFTTVLLQTDASTTDNQVDASTNTHTITEAGNVASSAFSPYHPGGYSTYFDGSGDYLTTPTDAGFAYGTGDFTIEAWVYLTAAPSSPNYRYIVGQGANTNDGCGIYIQGNNYKFWAAGAAVLDGTASGTQYELHKWQHVTVTRSGTTIKLFVDGVEAASATNSSNIQTGSSHGLTVGRWYEINDTGYWQGYIRDVRVVKGTAVYTSVFTLPTAPLTAISGTSLLTCHLPYIVDGSTNSHTLTVNGNTSTVRFSPYEYGAAYTKADHGGAVYFDGNGSDNITASNIAIAGDCTFEFWFYQDIAQSGAHRWLSGPSTYGGSTPFAIYTFSSDVQIWLDGSGSADISGAFTAFTWHHLALVRNSGTWTLYINGVAKGTSTVNGSYDFAATTDYRFGEAHAGGYDWRGYISDARFVSGTAVYTTAFTPPTAPLTAITNTSLLTCTNKNDIWDAGGTATGLAGNLFTRSGSVASSNTQRKFTTSSSIYYTGTYPRTVHYLGPETYFRTGDFTIEGWVWFNAVNVADGVFHLRAGALANDTNGLAVGIQNNGALRCYINNSQNTSTTIATAQTWIHFAVVRNSGSITFYINGTATNLANVSDTTDYQLTHLHTGVYYGTWPANYDLTGYIQSFRVTKGLARYTSNFTPPTQEFSG